MEAIVWVTHDESVFYANDDGWSDEIHSDLHKKGKGRSIMSLNTCTHAASSAQKLRFAEH
jgi:hypothetical protein